MSGDIVERLRLLARMYPLWGEVKTRSNEAADLLDFIEGVIRNVARDLYAAEVRRQGVGWDEHCTDLLVRSQHSLTEVHALLLHPKEARHEQ